VNGRPLVWLRNSPILGVFVTGAVAGYVLHPPTVNAQYRYAVSCISKVDVFQRTEGLA